MTTADMHLENARDKVKEAVRDLSQILIEECYGHDDYAESFNLKLESAFTKLRVVDKLLNNKDIE